MIGLDRPFRPEWIYFLQQMWQPGMSTKEFKEPFNERVTEFTGEDYKRKIRTILLRYYFATEGKARTKLAQEDFGVQVARCFSVDELKAWYLQILFLENPLADMILQIIRKRYGFGDRIDLKDIKKWTRHEHGERDVVGRSTGAFLKTLEWFGCLQEEAAGSYRFVEKLEVNPALLPVLIYGQYLYRKQAVQVDLHEVANQDHFYFLATDGIVEKLLRQTGEFWSHEKRVGGVERITLVDTSMDDFKVHYLNYLQRANLGGSARHYPEKDGL